MTTHWSDGVWATTRLIYDRILKHPFVDELAQGTLSAERFRFYLRQDALYLERYAAVLAHIAARLADKHHVAAFVRFASDGIAVEQALHTHFLGAERPSAKEITPTALLYTSFLQSQCLAPVEVAAAAVLPCFWIYQQVGAHILSTSEISHNPYARWIATYGDESFAAATREAIAICDELAEATTPAIRKRMDEVFRQAARMEWMFWDSAWNLEQWKI